MLDVPSVVSVVVISAVVSGVDCVVGAVLEVPRVVSVVVISAVDSYVVVSVVGAVLDVPSVVSVVVISAVVSAVDCVVGAVLDVPIVVSVVVIGFVVSTAVVDIEVTGMGDVDCDVVNSGVVVVHPFCELVVNN